MSDNMVAFLRARLDEDETVVRAAVGSTVGARLTWNRVEVWSGDRALAEVEAKRAIIDRYMDMDETASDPCESCWAQGLGEVVRTFAAAFDQHPDFRPEWLDVWPHDGSYAFNWRQRRKP